MAKTKDQAKKGLERAIEKVGGLRHASAICDVSEAGIKLWLEIGNLNKARTIHAQRLARAAGISIEDLIFDP